MKGNYIPFNDGYGIVGYFYECPECNTVSSKFQDCEEGCEKCKFSEPYKDPDDWIEELWTKNKNDMNTEYVAKALIEKIGDFIYTSNAHFADDAAEKNIALMWIEEMILQFKKIESNIDLSLDPDIGHWNKIKQEIIKL